MDALRAFLQAQREVAVALDRDPHLPDCFSTARKACKFKVPLRLPLLDSQRSKASAASARKNTPSTAAAWPTSCNSIASKCTTARRAVTWTTPEAVDLDFAVRMRALSPTAPSGAGIFSHRRAAHRGHRRLRAPARLARFHATRPSPPAGMRLRRRPRAPEQVMPSARRRDGRLAIGCSSRRIPFRPIFPQLAGCASEGGSRAVGRPAWAPAHVRQCHGVLHRGNVVPVWRGSNDVRGIEIDPRTALDRCRSTTWPSPFIDLLRHGRRDLAFQLLDGWLEASSKYSRSAGTALLPRRAHADLFTDYRPG